MSVFIMGTDDVEALHELRDRAAAEPVKLSNVMKEIKTAAGKERWTAFMETRKIVLPMGYTVVFSIEIHPKCVARHVSVAHPAAGQRPHPIAMEMIAAELGFTGSIMTWGMIYMEDLGDGHTAVNGLQVIEAGAVDYASGRA